MRKRSTGLQSLARGLDVLRLLAEQACTVEELSRTLEIPRSTAYRTLTALRDRQLVERDPRHARYTLGFGILKLARALLGRVPVREIALRTRAPCWTTCSRWSRQASATPARTSRNAGIPCLGSLGKYVPAKNGVPSGEQNTVIGHPP